MPIYEYQCARCGRGFELLVRGETVVACPACESRQVRRLISLPARPAGPGEADYSRLGPAGGGGCCGAGGCGCH